MKYIFIASILCISLMGCSPGKVTTLYYPGTTHFVKCSGSSELPEVVEVNRCIYDHKEIGYEVWRG